MDWDIVISIVIGMVIGNLAANAVIWRWLGR